MLLELSGGWFSCTMNIVTSSMQHEHHAKESSQPRSGFAACFFVLASRGQWCTMTTILSFVLFCHSKTITTSALCRRMINGRAHSYRTESKDGLNWKMNAWLTSGKLSLYSLPIRVLWIVLKNWHRQATWLSWKQEHKLAFTKVRVPHVQ
jgi:hypothetical protein